MASLNKKSIALAALVLLAVTASAGFVSAQENNATTADDSTDETVATADDTGSDGRSLHDGGCTDEDVSDGDDGTDASQTESATADA